MKEINGLLPNKTKVVYASDFSLRGGMDRGFEKSITWDTPLLEGYSYIILNNDVGTNFSKFGSLSGKGVFKLIKDHKPKAIFLNALINNKFFLTVYFCALIFRIPIWLRHETQENALPRGRLKNFIRSIFYRVLYLGINKAFTIGELNKQHYLKFGLDQKKMIPCRYGVLDSCSILNEKEKTIARTQCREELHITNDKLVITFSGKFIEKRIRC